MTDLTEDDWCQIGNEENETKLWIDFGLNKTVEIDFDKVEGFIDDLLCCTPINYCLINMNDYFIGEKNAKYIKISSPDKCPYRTKMGKDILCTHRDRVDVDNPLCFMRCSEQFNESCPL